MHCQSSRSFEELQSIELQPFCQRSHSLGNSSTYRGGVTNLHQAQAASSATTAAAGVAISNQIDAFLTSGSSGTGSGSGSGSGSGGAGGRRSGGSAGRPNLIGASAALIDNEVSYTIIVY
jgi:hypothetical protein